MNTRKILLATLITSLTLLAAPAAMADRYESHRHNKSYRGDYDHRHKHKYDRHSRYEERRVIHYYYDRPYDRYEYRPARRDRYYDKGSISLSIELPVR